MDRVTKSDARNPMPEARKELAVNLGSVSDFRLAFRPDFRIRISDFDI
jgi:hypothetical protein